MSGKDSRRTLTIAFAAVVVVASVAAMFWIWRSGGAPLSARLVRGDAAVEECGARLSGASSMALELAPAIVGDFLRQSGYEVGAARTLPDGLIRIEGRRGQVRCTVTIRPAESTTGFEDLASGEALVALSLRAILPHEIEKLKKANAGDFEGERVLAEHVVGYNAVAVIVHRSNRVARLDTDQVAEIYIGMLENWARVGGADSPVNIYAPLEQTGVDDIPNELVPSVEEAWVNAVNQPNMHIERDNRAVIAGVARDPTAIGFVSGASLKPSSEVRAVAISAGSTPAPPTVAAMHAQAYPLTHRVFLYVRPRDMRDNLFVRRFVAYFKSPSAHDRIEQVGFGALRGSAAEDVNAVAAMGCVVGSPETATVASALRGAQKSDVVLRFRPDTRELDDVAKANVAHLSPELIDKIGKGWHIVLVGHADAAGDLAQNRRLGLNRALAARTAFEGRGVFGLQAESAGENCPVADMDTLEGQRLNRRVEIWLRPPGRAQAGVAAPS